MNHIRQLREDWVWRLQASEGTEILAGIALELEGITVPDATELLDRALWRKKMEDVKLGRDSVEDLFTITALAILRNLGNIPSLNRLSNDILQDLIKIMSRFGLFDKRNSPKFFTNKLTELNISNSGVDDEVLSGASQCTNLQIVDVSYCPVSKIPFFGEKLASLKMDGTDVTDEELVEVLKRCPNLKLLSLANCNHLASPTIRHNSILEINLNGCTINNFIVEVPSLQLLDMGKSGWAVTGSSIKVNNITIRS